MIDVPEEFESRVMSLMLERRAELLNISQIGTLRHLEFTIPSRGLIGLKTLLLSATQGEATLNTVFKEYEAHRGEIIAKRNGVLLSMTEGEAVPFAIFNLEDRGQFLLGPGTELYEGMIVGLHSKENDLMVNLTKGKKLNNIRNSGGADEAVKLTPHRNLTLKKP